MKSLVLSLMAALSVCGCANISGVRTAPDGSTLALHTRRFLWSSDSVAFSLMDTNGLTVKLTVSKSRPDVEAMNSLFQGVAEGLAKGAIQGVK